ncbi:MAG: glycosyl hydrolase family 28-related protein [Terracidiphilus sp.]|jgi:hypothetical protein
MKQTALVLLILSVTVGGAQTGPASVSLPASNSGIGPRYDVTSSSFGAKGDNTTDDTAAIQAAFAACGNTFNNPPVNTQQKSGVVDFPGGRNYVVSRTIHTYNCQIQGETGNLQGSYSPSRILWDGATAGVVSKITAFSIASNRVTFIATNSLTAGQFVEIAGLTTGSFLNRAILEVDSAGVSATQFSATLPFSWGNLGATADSGTATTVNVIFALPFNARYQQSISSISLSRKGSQQTSNFDVGFYFGSRVDTGTRVENTWVAGASEYSYYFAGGGINVEFDKGWRSDSAGIAGIYWRVAGADSFGIANGTVDNGQGRFAAISGAAVMLDNAACEPNSGIHFTSRNIKVEINTSLAPGLGAFTLYDCPSEGSGEQFFMDFENTWMAPAHPSAAGFNLSNILVSPANDAALSLSVLNGGFPSGSLTNSAMPRFAGVPALSRSDIAGSSGFIPALIYSSSRNSWGTSPGTASSPIQLIGDVNISQLWQYGIRASDFLYSDTAFSALPNGTTLFEGQILAPPAYWSGVNGKRYALDVVYQTGTTGTPNGGQTSCSGVIHARVLTCTSATDLSTGQRISIGADGNKAIQHIDATHPDAVQVDLDGALAASHSNETLSFSAPLLASEMQMPTKSPRPPVSQSWAQGDMEQNSAATANGVAAWVNTAAGTPGSWAGIPLGDNNGKIAASQLSSARSAQAFCVGTASSSSTLLLFGAGTSQTACTQSPGPQTMQQVLMTGSGVLSRLAVRCGHLGSQPSSGTFSLWDLPSGAAMSNASSGTNTGVSVTIGNSSANANMTLIDTQHTFAYATGDMIRIQFTTQANESLADCTASFNY